MGNHEYCDECGQNDFHNGEPCNPEHRAAHQARKTTPAGSAETGGEKATPLTGSELTEFELRLKLRDADLLAKACDRQVELGQMDARSAISDARLNYGTPFKYEYLNMAESVQPEKLNAAHNNMRLFCQKCGFTKNCVAPDHSDGDRAEHCAKCHGPVAKRAAESSLSSPPPTEKL